MKLAKLITEAESICLISGKESQEEIEKIFMDANLEALYKHLSECVVNAKLTKPHNYRFKIQVHAQEIEEES